MPTLLPAILLALGGVSAPPDSTHCIAAARFLRTDRSMAAEIEADTLDDWRTQRRQPICRITAAGVTALSVGREAARFYERVRETGWTRTPDPRDSPNEASMRFRHEGSDCLFNVNAEALLMTDAEGRVVDAMIPRPGERRYHVFVMCMPAMPAAPRDTSMTSTTTTSSSGTRTR